VAVPDPRAGLLGDPDARARAPLVGARHAGNSVQQKSYVQLTRDRYRLASDPIAERARRSEVRTVGGEDVEAVSVSTRFEATRSGPCGPLLVRRLMVLGRVYCCSSRSLRTSQETYWPRLAVLLGSK
jgi:hypothetical protein